jgi:hypothetical protein
MSGHDPYRKLDRMLARERLRIWVGVLSLVALAGLLAFIFLPTPQSLGHQWADVVATAAASSDDGAGRKLDLRLQDGTRRRLTGSLVAGVTKGDRICVHVERNPVTGGQRIRQVPDRRCD